MAATISTIIIMIVLVLYATIGSYIIIVGDREESRQNKARKAEKEKAERKIILLS